MGTGQSCGELAAPRHSPSALTIMDNHGLPRFNRLLLCRLHDLMTEVRLIAEDEQGTDRLGAALAAAVEPGLVVALVGNLGAGKTRLVRSVATALGVDPLCVSSPTFVLIHEYDGRLPLYHFDTYRLRNSAEFLELGAEELLHGDGVCFIEWADRVASTLPADCLRVEIAACGETAREFRLTAYGDRSARCLARVAAAVDTRSNPIESPDTSRT